VLCSQCAVEKRDSRRARRWCGFSMGFSLALASRLRFLIAPPPPAAARPRSGCHIALSILIFPLVSLSIFSFFGSFSLSLSLSLFLSLPPQRPSCMLLLWIGSLRLRGRKYGANAGGSERSEVAPMKGTPRRRYRDLEHTNTQIFFFTAAVAAIALASRPCPWPSPWRRAAPTCASSPSPPPPSPASSSGTAPGSPGTWPCRCRGTS
jgi:hypothetical protein